jgi:hypothetical protein
MNIPGFSAQASLYKTSGHYHSTHAFTESGGNALRPAQGPWGCNTRCLWDCRRWCTRQCGSDRLCLLVCREDCYDQCNCLTP